MTTCSQLRRLMVVLASGASMIAMLSSCSTISHQLNKLTGNARPDQVVEGARRPPIDNPPPGMALNGLPADLSTGMQGDAPFQLNPGQTPGQHKNKALPGVINYNTPMTAPAPMTLPNQEVNRSMSTGNDIISTPSQTMPMNASQPKPLVSPVVAPQSSIAPLPAPAMAKNSEQPGFFTRMGNSISSLASGTTAASKTDDPRKNIAGNPNYSPETVAAVPVTPLTATAVPATASAPIEAAPSQPSWLSRNVTAAKNSLGFGGSTQEAKAPAPVINASYPNLSSVPQKPEQFQAMKANKQQKMEDLQSEHMNAARNKMDLDNEPSGQEALVPLTAAQSIPLAPAKLATPAATAQPVLLGHAAAPEIKPLTNAAVTPTPDYNAMAPAAAPMPKATVAVAPAVQQPMVPAAMPVKQVEAAAKDSADDTAALPSPDILKTVKMLPPSRYQPREQHGVQSSAASY